MTLYVFNVILTLNFHNQVTFAIGLSKIMSASNLLDEMEDFIRETIKTE